MTFITGTQTELLYAYYGASTNLATFTAEDNLMKTYPSCVVPGSIFNKVGPQSSSLELVCAGLVGTTVGPVRTLAHVVIEYVGNTDWPESSSFGDLDRRRNRASRVLMDHVRGQASARDATPSEVEQLVEELREAIRSAEGVD
jgi:hypothetical protein